MRLTHSSRWLRSAGWLAVTCGALGLSTRGAGTLLAQEAAPLAAPTAVQDAPALPDPDGEEPAGPLTIGEVLPDDVPQAVSSSVIQDLLPESWADWGTEVNELFVELYEDDPGAADADRIIRRLNVKKNTLDRAIADPKYRKIAGRLRDLRERIVKRLEVIGAVRELAGSGYSVDPSGETNRLFSEAMTNLVVAKNDLYRFKTGRQWIDYLKLDRLSETLGRRDKSEDAAELVDTVAGRLVGGREYDDEQADFLDRKSLNELSESLNALYDRLEDPQSARDATAEGIAELVQALEDFETFGSLEGSRRLEAALPALSAYGSGGARLASLIRRSYLNDNFRAAVGEGLIVSLLNNSRVERDIINDCIFGARVVGSQLASANLTVDLVPNSAAAAFRLNLSGDVSTDTRGIAKQATVYSRGQHNFFAHKDVTFANGDFASGPAVVSVAANNQVYAARARTRLPILRKIVRNIAIDRARELTPKSNALTRQKITDKVGGDFNREVNEMLGKAEGRLNGGLTSRLRSAGLYPEQQNVSTSDQAVNLSGRVRNSGELAAGTPPPLPVPLNGVAFQLHESFLNNALNRMNIAGRTLSNAELRAEFKRFGEQVAGRPLNAGGRSQTLQTASAEDGDADEEADESVADAKFVFDDTDPIRLRVRDGEIVLIMRAGLDLPEDKEDIPQQIITIPMRVRQVGTYVQLIPETPAVEPAERVRARLKQITRANVMRNKIQSTLPARQFDVSFNFALEQKRLQLALQTLDVAGGWITGTLQ